MIWDLDTLVSRGSGRSWSLAEAPCHPARVHGLVMMGPSAGPFTRIPSKLVLGLTLRTISHICAILYTVDIRSNSALGAFSLRQNRQPLGIEPLQ